MAGRRSYVSYAFFFLFSFFLKKKREINERLFLNMLYIFDEGELKESYPFLGPWSFIEKIFFSFLKKKLYVCHADSRFFKLHSRKEL